MWAGSLDSDKVPRILTEPVQQPELIWLKRTPREFYPESNKKGYIQYVEPFVKGSPQNQGFLDKKGSLLEPLTTPVFNKKLFRSKWFRIEPQADRKNLCGTRISKSEGDGDKMGLNED